MEQQDLIRREGPANTLGGGAAGVATDGFAWYASCALIVNEATSRRVLRPYESIRINAGGGPYWVVKLAALLQVD